MIQYLFSGTGHPDIYRAYLIWNSSDRTWNRTREKDWEIERASWSKAHICSAIYHGLLFPIVGESRRIVDAREEGPKRISKTVSDRICIENAKRTRAVHPITGPINCGLSLFSLTRFACFSDYCILFRRVQSRSNVMWDTCFM